MFANIVRVVRAIWAFIVYCLSVLKNPRTSSPNFDLPVAASAADNIATQVRLGLGVLPSIPIPSPIAGSTQRARALRAQVDQFSGGPFNRSDVLAVLGTSPAKATTGDLTVGEQLPAGESSLVKQVDGTEERGSPQTSKNQDTARLADEFEQIKEAIFDTPRKQKDKWSRLLDKCVAHFSVVVGDDSIDITAVSKARVVGNQSGLYPSTPASSPSLSEDNDPPTPSGDIIRFGTFKFPQPLCKEYPEPTDDVFKAPASHSGVVAFVLPPLPCFMDDDEEPGPIGQGSPVPSCPPIFASSEDKCYPAAACLFEGLESSISFASFLAISCDDSSTGSSPSDTDSKSQTHPEEDLTQQPYDAPTPAAVSSPLPYTPSLSCVSDYSVAEVWTWPLRSFAIWSPPRPSPTRSLPRTKTSPLRTHFPSICDMV